MAGCGPGETISISIQPTQANLIPGEMRQFTATISGSKNTSIFWQATCGSVAGTGNTINYIAPESAGECTLSATSQADNRKTANVAISIDINVAVQPISATLRPGESVSFTASVLGSDNDGVDWDATCGTISATGNTVLFTAPSEAGNCTLSAISKANSQKTASAIITTEVHVAIEPSSTTLRTGESVMLTATVIGSENKSVEWNTSCGQISATGTASTAAYTAPSEPGICTVTATSQADKSKSGTAIMTVELSTQVWAKQFGSSTKDEGAGVTIDADNNIVITGWTWGNIGLGNSRITDIFIAKYDSDGERIWIEKIGSSAEDKSVAIAVDASGNLIVVGNTDGSLDDISPPGKSIFVAKLNPAGEQLWLRQFTNTNIEYSRALVVDGVNIIISGISFTSPDSSGLSSQSIFVMKLDTDGQEIWHQRLDSGEPNHNTSITADIEGNIYAAGSTYGNLDGFNQGYSDAFIAKYDAEGNLLWLRQFGTAFEDGIASIKIDANDDLIIAGITGGNLATGNSGAFDIFVAKYDTDGNRIWLDQIGTPENDFVKDLAISPSGNIMLTGETFSHFGGDNRGGDDVFIARYSTSGDLLWLDQFGTPGNDTSAGIAVDTLGYSVIIGNTNNALAGENIGDWDVFILKISP